MIWLRWTIEAIEGLQEANTVKEETGQTPPMEKLASQRRKFQVFGNSVTEKFLPLSGSDRSFI